MELEEQEKGNGLWRESFGRSEFVAWLVFPLETSILMIVFREKIPREISLGSEGKGINFLTVL